MPVFSGAALGKYGREAGGMITFEWVPDPIEFQEKILYVKDQLADRTIPLQAASIIMQNDIRENFEGEHDPEGQPWKEWSQAEDSFDPVTNKWTKGGFRRGYANNLPPGHHGKILDRWGALKASATSPSAFVAVSGNTVNEDSLFYSTSGLPPYWEWHMTGVEDRNPGGDLPQRRFLGMSGEAQIQIMEEFDYWFMGILEVATSSKGNKFLRGRIPKGQPGAGRFMKLEL